MHLVKLPLPGKIIGYGNFRFRKPDLPGLGSVQKYGMQNTVHALLLLIFQINYIHAYNMQRFESGSAYI